MKTGYWYVLFIGLLLVGSACNNKQKVKKNNLTRIEQWGFPITDEYLQTYIGSFCYSTTYRQNETDYFLGYNKMLHTVDVLDLTNKNPYKQILLQREGRNAVLVLKGVEYYKGELIAEDNVYFFRIDMEGNILSRKAKDELYEQFPGYTVIKPGLSTYFSLYSFFFFNPETGEIAITLYSESNENQGKVVLIFCENWEVTDTIDIAYPDFILCEGNLGILSSVHAYPCMDKILYNFPVSSNIYSVDRKTKETTLCEVPSSIIENTLKIVESNEYDDDPSFFAGYYFPLRYDPYRKKFWRIQMGKRDLKSSMYTNRPYGISSIAQDMKSYNEYTIPENLGLYPNSLFFGDGVLFPYVQAPEENEIIFYLMKTGE